MSNINMRIKVVDKEMFWITLESYNGYKFQNNTFFGQFRVVSPDKYREAWGFNKEEIQVDFDRLSGKFQSLQTPQPEPIPQAVEPEVDYLVKLREIGELYKDGILEEEDYEALRKQYISLLKD